MIGVRVDSRDLLAAADFYGRMAEKHVPFAAARALTWTVKEGKTAAEDEAKSAFATPTPFTQRGFAFIPAAKKRLQADVIAKDKQASYLGYQVIGGTRRPVRKVLVRPGPSLRTDRYGNIPRGAVGRLAKKPGHFIGKPTGKAPAGIYKRPSKAKAKRGEGPQLMIAFGKTFNYRPRMDFYGRTTDIFLRQFPVLYERSLEQAIDNTKPR